MPEPTDMPVLLLTPDPCLPFWVEAQWRTSNLGYQARETDSHKRRLSSLHGQKRGIQRFYPFLPQDSILPWVPSPNVQDGGVPHAPGPNGRKSAVLSAGLNEVAKSLSNADRRRQGTRGTNPAIGWLPQSQLLELVQRVPHGLLGSLTWLVDAPAGNGCFDDRWTRLRHPQREVASQPNKIDRKPRTIRLPGWVLEEIHDKTAIIRKWVNQLPECLRENAIPNDKLLLYSACLTEVLHRNVDPEHRWTRRRMYSDCIEVSMVTVVRHLHWLQVCYPADKRGFFDGADLAILRFLSEDPLALPEIQEGFRYLRREELIRGLERAVAVNLAYEPKAGYFAARGTPQYQGRTFECDR